MDIDLIPLSQLQTNPQAVLSGCCDTGRAIIVQLPDDRLVAIQSLEPGDEKDSLMNELLETNPKFRALVEKSKASPRKEFVTK
ncbi:MAG TPA: hypothetical protein VGK58_00965 [Lacipirellulaceae bacterium]